MTDEERAAPDSLTGKLRSMLAHDTPETSGESKLETDAGMHRPADADEPEPVEPKRPTDPPF